MTESISHASGGGKPPLLELIDVSKHFGGVLALQSVSFELRPGEIHGLERNDSRWNRILH